MFVYNFKILPSLLMFNVNELFYSNSMVETVGCLFISANFNF